MKETKEKLRNFTFVKSADDELVRQSDESGKTMTAVIEDHLLGRRQHSEPVEMPMLARELRKELRVGSTYMAALLDACGLKGMRLVHKSTVLGFLKRNPTWRMSRKSRK